jgi:hypothetical protein
LVGVPISKAQQRSVAKFNESRYDSALIRLPKGKHLIVQEHAKNLGLSFNAFVLQSIDAALSADIIMPPAVDVSTDIIMSPAVDKPCCLHCGGSVVGRKGKKFCSDNCRVNNHKKAKRR